MSSLPKLSSVDTTKALLDPPLLILRRMPSTLRSASTLAALWQCQHCNRTNDSAKNKRHCFLCRAWRDGLLQRGRATTASVTLYGTIWYYFMTPPPPPFPGPCLFLCCLLCHLPSATRHSLPVIRCLLLFAKFTTQSSQLLSLSPPALVALFAPPALWHCPHCCCRDAPMQKS